MAPKKLISQASNPSIQYSEQYRIIQYKNKNFRAKFRGSRNVEFFFLD
ncbi:hypothetical protein [Flavobacterium anhuiense]